MLPLILAGVGGLLLLAIGGFCLTLRRVVPTNEVHIVQSSKKTTSYGKDTVNGNTYYEWPSWLPIFGIDKVILPVSVFDLKLIGYEAYDKGRLPFVIDVTAFFRIADSNMAAARVSSFDELNNQLEAIVQGAARTILASNEIEDIMQGRSKFGEEFTNEVGSQLKQWGVETVKNIELMDIRDSKDSKVIHNIMDKKKSHIEMESRQEVAKNKKSASLAEIEAQREVDVEQQVAFQSVGLKKASANQEVDVAMQTALQAVKEQERITKEKEMAVIKIQQVQEASIKKEALIIEAEQDKQTVILKAEGSLQATKHEAEGIKVTGEAKAEAEKQMQVAPVEAQIMLAKEIGENVGYQQYLIEVRRVEMAEAVGSKQAEALKAAGIKIISNSGDPVGGLNNVMDLFSTTGGTKVGAMLEAFGNTDAGKAIGDKLLGAKAEASSPVSLAKPKK